jgi:hypothetical protein
MKAYLKLQFALLNRQIRDLGMNPVVGYVLMAALFVGVCELMFVRVPKYAPYIIMLFCLTLQNVLSKKERSDFLHIVYGGRMKSKIRIVENMIVGIPIFVILLIHNQYIITAATLILSVLAAFVETNSKSFVMPTPFSKNPFEFSVGFRQTFFFFPLIYGLTIISVIVDNLNLGLASVFMLCLLITVFYLNPENEYFVWIYAKSPAKFLMHMTLTIVKNTSLLALPMIVLMAVFFTPDVWQALLILAVGELFITTIMLAKYSVFPNQIGIMEMIFVALLFVPPFFLLVIPYFYFNSIKQLNNYLYD